MPGREIPDYGDKAAHSSTLPSGMPCSILPCTSPHQSVGMDIPLMFRYMSMAYTSVMPDI